MLRALLFPFRKCRELRDYGGPWMFLKGLAKVPRLWLIGRRYRLSVWNLTPVEWRPYAIEVVDFVNDLVRREGLKTVVDIGCGLGEILVRIRGAEGVGYDIHEPSIRAASEVQKNARFLAGSFTQVRGHDIDVLMIINFIHNFSPDQLRGVLEAVLKANRVRYLVVDKVRYKYYHDFDSLLRGLAVKVWESRKVENDRQIQCYRCQPVLGDAAPAAGA